MEEARLVDGDLKAKAAEREAEARGGHGGEAYEEEEEGGGGQRMACAQQ